MNDKTIEMIKELAAKLGTTTEHLWAVLVRQAPISSTCDLLSMVAAAVVLVVASKGLIRGIKNLSSDFDHDGINMPLVIVSGGLVILSGVLLILGITSLGTTLSGFVNPEFWALKQIIP